MLVRIIADIFAVIVSIIAPIAVGIFAHTELSDALDAHFERSRGVSPGGCLAFFPAMVVSAVCYGHFYLGYLVYKSLGVLRPHIGGAMGVVVPLIRSRHG